MDLMGPMQVESTGGRRYIFVCVDDFSRYTWVEFHKEKSDTFNIFEKLCLRLKNEKAVNIEKIVRIRSDHGKEFENTTFTNFYNKHGITHEFSAPKTLQQNGVVERKNRTLQEIAQVMLNSKKLSSRLWAEAVNSVCYTINMVYLRPGTTKTPYEIWKGKKPNFSHFHIFGCICYILNDKEQLGKCQPKSDKGVFLVIP